MSGENSKSTIDKAQTSKQSTNESPGKQSTSESPGKQSTSESPGKQSTSGGLIKRSISGSSSTSKNVKHESHLTKRSSSRSLSTRKSDKNSDTEDEELTDTESVFSDVTSSLRSQSAKSNEGRRTLPVEKKRCSKARMCCRFLFLICKIFVVLATLILLLLLAIGFFMTKLPIQCKIDELSSNLHSNIYGQDLAIKTILGATADFCSGNNDRPLTLVFWGPTGVGKTALATIFTHHFDSNGQVVPSEHYKAIKYKDWYGNRLRNTPFVYTIDDVMDVEEMGDIAANTDEFSFPLILVLTTSMESHLLNESFIDWCVKGLDEMDFTYKGKDPLWLTELRPLNPIVLPFLPLSRTNIKLCIEKTLNRLKMKYVKDDVEKIANEFEFFHNNKRLYSKIGCKRVNDKIFSVLSP